MRTSLALIFAAVLALSSSGCANCSLRSLLHRGADCGTTVPTTLPLVGGMTSYTPGCGIEEACPTCGITGAQPYVYEGGYPVDGSIVLPTPE